MADFIANVVQHLQAGYQALYVPTLEEYRCEQALRAATEAPELKKTDYRVITWNCVDGFVGLDQNTYLDPVEALRAVPTSLFEGNRFLVFRDLPELFAGNLQVRRAFKTLCESGALVNPDHLRPVFVLSPTAEVHPEIAPLIALIEFPLPDVQRLEQAAAYIEGSLLQRHPQLQEAPPAFRQRLVQSLRGLTVTEAENALSLSVLRHKQSILGHGSLVEEMLDSLEEEKATIIRKSEVLSYVPKELIASEKEIGGYGELLDFVRERAVAYSPEASAAGLDRPKGIVLLGVPGTGKSMVGKAIARMLGLPLAIFDFASVFASLVGDSERRMRTALRTVEALEGCVLLLDEADKALGGAHESSGDSGVTRRVFGQLLTWLAEKNDRTFVVATLNRIDGLPPELLRKGRFDEVFYTDIPDRPERQQILAIHLCKRGIDPTRYSEAEWEMLLDITKDFVGSELEELIRAARFRSFEKRQDAVPALAELLACARQTIPIAKLDAESVQRIREFCQKRARPVARQAQPATGRPARILGGLAEA